MIAETETTELSKAAFINRTSMVGFGYRVAHLSIWPRVRQTFQSTRIASLIVAPGFGRASFFWNK